MPSSAHPTCYTGPSCVAPQPSTQHPVQMFYYKNTGPASGGGVVSPTVPTPPSRTRLVLHESSNQTTGSRFNPPGSQHMNDYPRVHTRTNHHTPQPNGLASNPPDIMSLSVHSPSPNVHYWPNSPAVTATPTPNTLSPYSRTTTTATTTTTTTNNNTHSNYATNPNAAATYEYAGKHNGGSKSINAPNKVSGTCAGSRPLWKERPHVGRYSLIRTIGKGNFAKVKLAQHLTTGMQVAVKVIDKTLLNHSSMHKLFREVRVLKTLNHPNIIKLLEVIESERHLYLVMEYASGGEVFDYLVSHGKMKESVARVKFRQIVSAVQYCHQKMVVHRDLKAENLLLDEDLNIKIADFGFSNYFYPTQQLDTFCGSPPYAAPELFLGRKYDGPEVDVWSLGVILYTLVSGTLPFDGKNLKELRERVLRGTYRVPFYMTHECEMLLKKMLVLNPAKRLSLTEVMRDPWLNAGLDSILRPFAEPPADYCDPERISAMVRMGFQPHEIQDALTQQRFNNITATYILLGRYNPQIHGRLPNNLSNSATRTSKSDSRSRGTEFTLNGPTQPVMSVTDTPLVQHAARPASALPASHQPFTNNSAPTRRTPDEGLISRNTSSVTRTPSDSQSIRKDSVPTQSVSASSSSTATTSSSSAETAALALGKITTSPLAQPHRSHGLRRSATTSEQKTVVTSAPPTTTVITPSVTTTPRPSVTLPPTTGTSLHVSSCAPDSVSLQPSLLVATQLSPPSVTTAHFTLSNGPAVAQISTGIRLSSTSSPSDIPRSRSSVRCSGFTAPLARVEDETTGPNPTNRKTGSKDETISMGSSRDNTASNGVANSASTSDSSSSDPDSDSDVCDQDDALAGESNASLRRSDNVPQPQTKPSPVTSVVVAAAPTVNAPFRLPQSTADRKIANSDRPAINKESPQSQPRAPHFARMPSVRRKWSTRTSTPTTTTITVTTIATATPLSSFVGSRELRTDTNAVTCSRPVTTAARLPRDAVLDKESPKPHSDRGHIQPPTKPRSLFRGPPNAADILNEANPFRLTTDNLRPANAVVSTASSTVATQPITPQTLSTVTSSRTFSPPPAPSAVTTLTSTTMANRRPIAPPPLATAALSGVPNRTSYAYHSLRLPSSTTTTSIAMGKVPSPFDLNTRQTNRLGEPSVGSFWLRGASPNLDDGMATPTPATATSTEVRELYGLPFNRNLPERSTIQHVPTGRARERLEGPSTASRLVRHPGTQSIANQSMRVRTRSPAYVPESRDQATPRPVSPDDLSISSVTSSVATLGHNLGGAVMEDEKHSDAYPTLNYPNRVTPSVTAARQSNTLGSPVHATGVQPSARRELHATGGLNNFFRTLTTRISRSKLFRRSSILQSDVMATNESTEPRNRPDSMTSPTLDLDKMVASRGSSSPDGVSTARFQRSRSGVTPHRPVSQVTPRHHIVDHLDEQQTIKRVTARTTMRDTSDERRRAADDACKNNTIGRKWSKRSISSQDGRSHSIRRPSKVDPQINFDECISSHSQDLVFADDANESASAIKRNTSVERSSTNEHEFNPRSKSRRSMRYVLKPFARWPLDDVMVEVKRALTNHGVDFELVGERKLQCVYGDPSYGCRIPTTVASHTSGPPKATLAALLDTSQATGDGVVHWEMEVGKLAGVGMNGIRFKRINGSMATFKQIAKKLAADLRL